MLLNATRSLPLSGKAAPFKIGRDETAEVLFGSTDTVGHLICVNALLAPMPLASFSVTGDVLTWQQLFAATRRHPSRPARIWP
jgi:hypothetical protein